MCVCVCVCVWVGVWVGGIRLSFVLGTIQVSYEDKMLEHIGCDCFHYWVTKTELSVFSMFSGALPVYWMVDWV